MPLFVFCFLTICLLSTEKAWTDEQAVVQNQGQVPILTYKDAIRPLIRGPFVAEAPYAVRCAQFMTLKKDRTAAIVSLTEALNQRGYRFKSVPAGDEINVGGRLIQCGQHPDSQRLVSDDGGVWLDFIPMGSEATCRALWEKVRKNKVPYTGYDTTNLHRVYFTVANDEPSIAGAFFNNNDLLINIGIKLAIPVPPSIASAQRDEAGSGQSQASWGQENLRELKRGLEMLADITRLLVENLIMQEDLVHFLSPEELQGVLIQHDPTNALWLRKSLDYCDRLEGFVHFWSEVKFNFAFFDHVPDLDWDAVLREYLPRIEQATTLQAYYRLLQSCAALLKDGHTDVSHPSLRTLARPPIRLSWGEEGVLITDVGSELKMSGLSVGMEITQIDGIPVQSVLAHDVVRYICTSTEQSRRRMACNALLEGMPNTDVNVTVCDASGQTANVRLRRHDESGFWDNVKAFEYKEMDNDTLYIALNSFAGNQVVSAFDELLPQLRSKKGLILDVRENGGGDTSNAYAIIGRLIDKPVEGSHWKTRKYMPAFRAWGKEEEWYTGSHGAIEKSVEDPYLGPVLVLIGPGTYSAAEDFVVALHSSGRATLVGEPTAGSTGQPLSIALPCGGDARVCTKRDAYPDGREFVGVGIQPDVAVSPTRLSISSSEDVVLEAALNLLTKQ